MNEIIDWMGNPIQIEQTAKPEKNVNPCLALYGPGPEDKKCQDCALIAGICLAKTYYKCRLRKNSHSKASDHKLRWPACAKFEQREKDIPLYDGR